MESAAVPPALPALDPQGWGWGLGTAAPSPQPTPTSGVWWGSASGRHHGRRDRAERDRLLLWADYDPEKPRWRPESLHPTCPPASLPSAPPCWGAPWPWPSSLWAPRAASLSCPWVWAPNSPSGPGYALCSRPWLCGEPLTPHAATHPLGGPPFPAWAPRAAGSGLPRLLPGSTAQLSKEGKAGGISRGLGTPWLDFSSRRRPVAAFLRPLPC